VIGEELGFFQRSILRWMGHPLLAGRQCEDRQD